MDVAGAAAHRPQAAGDTGLSRALAFVLRHGAARLGIHIGVDGFVPVDAILGHRQFRRYTAQDVQRVVQTNDKQRFTLRAHPHTGALLIRANQGHSVQDCGPQSFEKELQMLEKSKVEELELEPVEEGRGNVPAQAVHGTFHRHWPRIRVEGLRRMSRRHIHLAAGLPGDTEIISGMRSSCDLAIFVDLRRALSDGIPFFLSANRVILTPGDGDGVLPPRYFQKVLQLKPTRCLLPLSGAE